MTDTGESGFLARRRILLSRTTEGWFVGPDSVWFHRPVDGPDDDYPAIFTVCIDDESWDELGRPDVITVTLEPGDTLNVDLGSQEGQR